MVQGRSTRTGASAVHYGPRQCTGTSNCVLPFATELNRVRREHKLIVPRCRGRLSLWIRVLQGLCSVSSAMGRPLRSTPQTPRTVRTIAVHAVSPPSDGRANDTSGCPATTLVRLSPKLQPRWKARLLEFFTYAGSHSYDRAATNNRYHSQQLSKRRTPRIGKCNVPVFSSPGVRRPCSCEPPTRSCSEKPGRT